jgi:SAM-dependent methyltransferase
MKQKIYEQNFNMLNIGCGSRFHPAWENIDFHSSSASVKAWDLRKGIPYPDGSFDVVYHSHVLEHFPRIEGCALMRECCRVLKKGGVLRVAVPDLEGIARHYLQSFDQALAGSEAGAANHEWMTLELYDQAVRHKPGGEIQGHLASKLSNEAFILERWGNEARALIAPHSAQPSTAAARNSFSKKLLRVLLRLAKRPATVREVFIRMLLGSEYPLLELGRFRVGGSIHQWMYDRVSLAALFHSCGFSEICLRSAVASSVEGWSGFHLDTQPDGTVYKPDSLFLEGKKSSY